MKVAEDQVVEDDSSFQDDEVRFGYFSYSVRVNTMVSLFKEKKDVKDLP